MTQEETDLAISTCLLAGQILIENGSNMERVNDTMYRIAANAGLQSFQAFTTVTGGRCLIESPLQRPGS